ncbi:MAG: LytTR family transcriptional regulator [Bacteroidales bacterium]|nr:LytTR family transcriptional regulator [Bacteroidales bacterium]
MKTQIKKIEKTIYSPHFQKKIQISTGEGIKLINLNDIEYFEADGSYTKIHFIDKNFILSSKHLKNYESVLSERNFYRIGRTHIINLDCIKGYNKHTGGPISMENGCIIVIPRRKKEEFINYLNSYLNIL